MNNVLEFVLFPLLSARDLCASAQVCKLWLNIARRIVREMFLQHALQYYAATGQYEAYVQYAEPAHKHIIHAIMRGQADFVLKCNIQNITLDTQLHTDACNLRDYLIACVESSRDDLFTKLYPRGGWYRARVILPIAARHGSIVACRQVACSVDAPTIGEAVRIAHSSAKRHIVQYLLTKYGTDLPVSMYYQIEMKRIIDEFQDGFDYKSDCDLPDDTQLDLFS